MVWAFKVQGSQGSGFRGFQVQGFQGSGLFRLVGFQILGSQGPGFPRFRVFKVQGFQRFRVSKVQGFQGSGFPGSVVGLGFQGSRLSRFRV